MDSMGRLQIALVGCGRISGLHAAGYRDCPEAALALACDSDLGAARACAETWSIPRATASFEEVLADPRIDGVEILVPSALHEDFALRALAAGKHVSVQKPMTTSLSSADRMIAGALRVGKVLKVAENFVFYPPVVLAKRLMEDGAIGDPTGLRMKMLSGAGGGWDVPDKAWAWRLRDFAAGMGMNTFDHGHHMWSMAFYLLGEVEKVGAWIDETKGVVDSPAVVQWKHRAARRYGQCEFQYGAELSLPSSYYADDEWLDLSGSRGILTVNRGTAGVRGGPEVSLFTGGVWKHYEAEGDWSAGFRGSTLNFVAAILGREAPRLSMAEARHVLAVDLAVAKADRLCRTVWVDELDSPFPSLHAALAHRAERKARRDFFASLQDRDRKRAGAGEGARARELTLGLASRFRPEAALGFVGEVALSLSGKAGPSTFVLRFHGGSLEILEGEAAPGAMLAIRTDPDTWASILSGKARIELAYLRGRLGFEGEITRALRLKDIFGL